GGAPRRHPQVTYRRLPLLAPHGVMGEALDVLAQALWKQRFDRLHDARVERLALALQQARIGDLVRERMLERVLLRGKRARLQQEFGSNEGGERIGEGA